MKKFLENLLIVAALLLCGLCAYQWQRESRSLNQIKELQESVSSKEQTITTLQASNAKLDQQVSALSAKVSSLESTNREQGQVLFGLQRDMRKMEARLKGFETQNAMLKTAVEERNQKLTEQQETIKKVMLERNEVVEKSNKIVADRNDIVKKYNELVESYEKLMSNSVAKAASPKPPK